MGVVKITLSPWLIYANVFFGGDWGSTVQYGRQWLLPPKAICRKPFTGTYTSCCLLFDWYSPLLLQNELIVVGDELEECSSTIMELIEGLSVIDPNMDYTADAMKLSVLNNEFNILLNRLADVKYSMPCVLLLAEVDGWRSVEKWGELMFLLTAKGTRLAHRRVLNWWSVVCCATRFPLSNHTYWRPKKITSDKWV